MSRGANSQPIMPGTSVDVRTRFDGQWASGFEVADLVDTESTVVRYKLRRRSDGAILPVLFSDEEITSAGASLGTG